MGSMIKEEKSMGFSDASKDVLKLSMHAKLSCTFIGKITLFDVIDRVIRCTCAIDIPFWTCSCVHLSDSTCGIDAN